MAISRGPRLVTNGLVLALDPSDDNSFAAQNLPIKNGLILWLDAADDDSFVYSSGTSVSQWRDKSGLNNHANQSTTVQQPLRNTTNNSRKSVSFNAGNLNNIQISSGIALPSDASIFIIYKPATQAYAYAVLIDNYHGQNGNYGFVIQRVATNSQFYYGNAGDGAGFIDTSASPWTYTDNVIQLLSLNKASSTGTPYISGTAQTPRSVRAATAQSTTALSIGYWGHGGGRYYNGDICEILIFNRSLSATEMKQVHTYLGQKWGIINTDRTVYNLADYSKSGLLGNGSTSNMPLYDYYNKGAFKFYAGNKYIKLGNNTSVNQFAGDFTVSLWAMATAENSNYGNLIGDYYTAGVQTTNEWQIMMNNSSAFLNVYRHGTGYIVSNTSSGFSANTWINVVLTRIGSAITLYANNTVIATATNSSVFGSATGSVNIGIDGNNSAEPFSGLISNVLIYNKGLTATEVAQNYNTQKSRYINTIVQQGLVLNLDAGNNYSYAGSGTVWYDVSGNSNNGTLTNGPTYNADVGGNIVFDGSNDYVAVTSAASIKNTSNLSLEGWVFISSAMNYYGGIIGKGISDSQEEYCLLVHSVNSKVYMDVGAGGGPYTDATFSFSLNTWYHIIGTHERIAGSSAIKIYVNGSLLSSSTINPTNAVNDNTTNVSIGSRYDGGTSVWNGKIATARIYTRTLSAAEVLQNYNATKSRYGL